jgi:hypothetical protein
MTSRDTCAGTAVVDKDRNSEGDREDEYDIMRLSLQQIMQLNIHSNVTTSASAAASVSTSKSEDMTLSEGMDSVLQHVGNSTVVTVTTDPVNPPLLNQSFPWVLDMSQWQATVLDKLHSHLPIAHR